MAVSYVYVYIFIDAYILIVPKIVNCVGFVVVGLFVCFGGSGVSTWGFVLAKQVLYHLSHTSSLVFALVVLEMGSHKLFAWAGLNHDPPDLSLPRS
jgi:hypothetical protein